MLWLSVFIVVYFFFFNDTATTEIYTLSLHDALPISLRRHGNPVPHQRPVPPARGGVPVPGDPVPARRGGELLRAARGEGRARLLTPHREPGRRRGLCPDRERAAARNRRRLALPAAPDGDPVGAAAARDRSCGRADRGSPSQRAGGVPGAGSSDR